MPGMIALDFDGTLLRSDKSVSRRTVEALGRAADLGWTIVGATGRTLGLARRVSEMVPSMRYLACANGSQVVRLDPYEVCLDSVIDTDLATEAAQRIRARLAPVAIGFDMRDDSLIWEPGFDAFLKLRPIAGGETDDAVAAVLGRSPGAEHPESVRKVIAASPDIDAHDLVGLIDDALHGLDLGAAHSGLPFVEIGAPGVSKASGLDWLAAHLEVPATDCIAFGDEINDHEMLQWAGTGVAMGNATESTKAIADAVTESNDNDGVATYLEACSVIASV